MANVMKRFVLLVIMVMAASASATPHIPKSQMGPEMDFGPARLDRRFAPRAPTHAEALAQLTRLLAFQKSMQYLTTCNDAGTDAGTDECEYGGILEYENEPLPNGLIVESDNTQEAVWDWSFGKQVGTPNWTYQPQIDLAFMYLDRLPGWLECNDGGGPCPDYYSFYNCGWGMRAVIEYETANPGDMSHHAYGAMCASHAQLAKGFQIMDLADAATEAWTASGLWLWGDYTSDQTLKDDAAMIGGQVKAWLDATPSRVHMTYWAASGGATFYGVVNSYMKEHPTELQPWVTTMAPQLGGWIDESQADPQHHNWTDWRNAWNAWNMLANFAAYHVMGEPVDSPQLATALSIYQMLIAQDTDMDGGIQGSQQRPNSEDEAWITSYSAYFGIREVLALSEATPDGGAGSGGAGDGSGGSGGNPGTGSSDSGCSCNVGGRAAPSALVLLVGLTALTLRRRRR
jgi:MYXO-CTERM domain-containing protein